MLALFLAPDVQAGPCLAPSFRHADFGIQTAVAAAAFQAPGLVLNCWFGTSRQAVRMGTFVGLASCINSRDG